MKLEEGCGQSQSSGHHSWSWPSMHAPPSQYFLRRRGDQTHLQVMIMVFSPSQDGLSAMILA